MPAAHLPTPANLPNLNAKSAGAPPVRWRRERDGELSEAKQSRAEQNAREKQGKRKANREDERQKDRYRSEERTSERERLRGGEGWVAGVSGMERKHTGETERITESRSESTI